MLVVEVVWLVALTLVRGAVSLLSSSNSLTNFTMGNFLCMSINRVRMDTTTKWVNNDGFKRHKMTVLKPSS